VDRHPTVAALLLLAPTALLVNTDARRLITAVSTFGRPIGEAIAFGVALAASSIGVVAWWITSTTRASRAGRYDRSSTANRWHRRAGAAWVVACVAAALATHYPFRHHTVEQWRLTDRLSATTVAYLLVLMLAITVVLIVVLIVMPVIVRRENAVRRRASARKQRSTGA
jgi:hypothetical protein